MDYKLTLIIIHILYAVSATVYVFLSYGPTKEILQKNLRLEVEDFHKKYICDNYQLGVMGMNGLESVYGAIRLMNRNREEYFNVPEADILAAYVYVAMLTNYRKYTINVLKFIGLLMTIELGIIVGLELL